MPRGTLERHGYTQECADIGDGPVQFLKVHIQRLAVGAAGLLVQADAMHVQALENRLIQNLLRIGHVLFVHLEFDPADKI